MNNPQITPNRAIRMQLDWLVALIPALVWATYLFGARVLTITALAVAVSLPLDYLLGRLTKRAERFDLRAVVLAVLAAFNLSATASFVTVILTILIVHSVRLLNLKNPLFKLNAVLFARGLMTFVFSDMKFFPAPFTHPSPFSLWFSQTELSDMSVATPLSELADNKFTTSTVYDLFIGNSSGFIGEISATMLILGGIYLIVRRIVSWQIPFSFIASVIIISLIFPQSDNVLKFTLSSVFCGSTILCAFFIAPLPGTIPITPGGKLFFGIGCGIITMAVRYFLFSEGCVIAVLIMNIAAPYLDIPFAEKGLYKVPKPKKKRDKEQSEPSKKEQSE